MNNKAQNYIDALRHYRATKLYAEEGEYTVKLNAIRELPNALQNLGLAAAQLLDVADVKNIAYSLDTINAQNDIEDEASREYLELLYGFANAVFHE